LIRGDLSGAHASGPHDRQAIFHTGQSIGDFCEIILPKLFAGDGDLAPFIDDGPGPVIKERTGPRDGLQNFLTAPINALSCVVRIGGEQIHFHPAAQYQW
jgi:hypothetical protein